MVFCKICKNEFKPNHHKSTLCSDSCREQNKQLIKRLYYERNRELVINRSAERRLSKPEDQRTYYHKNKHKHKKTRAIYAKKYKSKNKEKVRAYQREYEQRPERKARMEEYRANPENKKRSNESGKRYSGRNPRVAKNGHLKRNYGITIDIYDKMLSDQHGVCKICKSPETEVDRKHGKLKDLAVDHCHETGVVRGLLCGRCNKALGKFEDNPELLRYAADYLETSKGDEND